MKITKKKLAVSIATVFFAGNALCQASIYRCPDNTYVIDLKVAKEKHCMPLQSEKAPTKFERAQFENCQLEASKAPTELGVATGLRVCRERFGHFNRP